MPPKLNAGTGVLAGAAPLLPAAGVQAAPNANVGALPAMPPGWNALAGALLPAAPVPPSPAVAVVAAALDGPAAAAPNMGAEDAPIPKAGADVPKEGADEPKTVPKLSRAGVVAVVEVAGAPNCKAGTPEEGAAAPNPMLAPVPASAVPLAGVPNLIAGPASVLPGPPPGAFAFAISAAMAAFAASSLALLFYRHKIAVGK